MADPGSDPVPGPVDTIEIPSDHTGPATSAQGGIAAGLLGGHVDGPAEVRLNAPPPLGEPLELDRGDDGSLQALRDGTTIMSARPAGLEVAVPDVDVEQARQPGTPVEPHLAPMCIVCGPEHPRTLGIYAVPVDDARAVACNWRPPGWVDDGGGRVREEILWGVLDCPGGWSIHEFGDVPDDTFNALGTMVATVREPVAVGEPVVAMGWPLGSEGRKHRAGSAVVGVDGTVRAVARQTCIAMPKDFARR